MAKKYTLPKTEKDLNKWFSDLEKVAPGLKKQAGYMRYWGAAGFKFANFAERVQRLVKEQYSKTGTVKFVDFDTETTGLSPARKFFEGIDGITDIAGVIVDADGYHGYLIEEDGTQIEEDSEFIFNSLSNPGVPIPDAASEVTGITDEMVKDAPSQYQVLRDFKKFSEGALFVGHNIGDDLQNKAGYDISTVLGPIYNRYFNQNTETLLARGIDTKPLFDGLVSGIPHTNDNFVKMFGIKLVGAHRALPDVNVNALAWSKIFPLLMSLDVELLREHSQKLTEENSSWLSYIRTQGNHEGLLEDWVELGVKLDKKYNFNKKRITLNIKYNPYEDEFIYEDTIIGDWENHTILSKETIKEIATPKFLRRAVRVYTKNNNFDEAISSWVGVYF